MSIFGRWMTGLLACSALAACSGGPTTAPAATAAPVAAPPAPPAVAATAAGDPAYRDFVARFLPDYFAHNPRDASDLGLHQYDGRLKDVSREGIAAELESLRRSRGALAAIDPATLSEANRLDREFLLNVLDLRLLDQDLGQGNPVHAWSRFPDYYSSGLTNAAYSLIKREYAPAEQRLKSLIEREKLMPASLAAARRNLDNPPRIYTEIAIEQLDGNREFFRSAVVEAFAGVNDAALLAEFKRGNDAVVAALDQYKTWLEHDLLPRSNGSFAYGPELYAKELRASEMIDTPLDELLRFGYADLRKNQQAFAETARLIDPKKSPREVLESMQKDHPPPDKLLATTQAELDALARFLTERHIVTIPSAEPARVQETPPFMRATTSASMDTPGPFEQARLHGYYSMTLPDPAWPAAKTEDFMRQWYYALITNVSVHEVWPGHYLQFLYAKDYPSDIRKVFSSNANSEGWAHYCEQMVLDQGFHAGEPKYRIAQLQDALLRNARLIVGIEMHTRGMTFEQAKKFFEEEGYQPAPVALSETKRGTSDALYGYYTLGKLAILKLREDYRAQKGAAFSLQEFHDSFIKLGPLPLPLVREAMLGEKGATF